MKPIKLILTICILILQLGKTEAQETVRLYNTAVSLYEQKKYAASLQALDQLIEKGEFEFSAYFKRSYCHYNLGAYEKAIIDIEKAYEFAPKDNRYFYFKGQTYDKLKKMSLASYYLDMAVKFQPKKLYYYKYRAAFNLDRGKYAKAEHDYTVLIGANQFDYKRYHGRGLALFNQKMKTEACLDWLHARDHNKASKRLFFYNCTDLDLRNKELAPTPPQLATAPEFKNNRDSSIVNYLTRRVTYSIDNLRNNEEGYVIASFTVTKAKTIENIEFLYSTNPVFENDLKLLIQSASKYIQQAAMLNGQTVDYTYILPIRFQLDKPKHSISELRDSLKGFEEFKDYENICSISEKILSRNPFLIEVQTSNNAARKKLGLPEEIHAIKELADYSKNNYEFINEVWAKPTYYKTNYDSAWQISLSNEAVIVRISEWDIAQVHNLYRYDVEETRDVLYYEDGAFYDYLNNETLVAKGEYKAGQKEGLFEFYHDNNNLKARFHYKNDQLIDSAFFFHDNGQLKATVVFNHHNFHILSYQDEQGKDLLPNGNGSWEYTNSNPTYNTIQIVGKLNNYERHGIWLALSSDDIIIEEKYKNGNFRSGKFYENGKRKLLDTKLKSTKIQSWIFTPAFLGKTEQRKYTKAFLDEQN